METHKKIAIVLGATGLVGGLLLDMLLQDERYSKVVVFSRRDFPVEHPKLEKKIGNLLNLQTFVEDFKADEVYCCIGTTKSKTPNDTRYREIDYGIPVEAAELSQSNGVSTFIVISALGANDKSSIFYNRIKGEMERDVLRVGIPKTHIVQPSLIGGERNEKRSGELFFKKLMSAIEFLLIGPLKRYRVIEPESIAKAMIWLANNPYEEKRIPSVKLEILAKNGTS
ncbi:NAD(P)H-binding protein [Muricauda sp. JGD-17]|uniref:NAD(P)H-binding protein n=1 Tax=Flagellimonas ochracea TaxID=2696472 RepID=A0A964TBI2_9FLAO|nr:NAD-dependent epimerase/dehydratase family protein [Allomuricauda ochracea]NAY91815.1 NAD(P)H-binding protein [Allomuricauda ochracea]